MDRLDQAKTRARALGRVGVVLWTSLCGGCRRGLVPASVGRIPEQISAVGKLRDAGEYMVAGAYSVLCCDWVIQVGLSDTAIVELATAVMGPLLLELGPQSRRHFNPDFSSTRRTLPNGRPLKRNQNTKNNKNVESNIVDTTPHSDNGERVKSGRPLKRVGPSSGCFSYDPEVSDKEVQATLEILSSCSAQKGVYARKAHPGASNKVNIFFSELWPEVRKHYPAVMREYLAWAPLTEGLYDDQAGSCLLYACGLSRVVTRPYAFALSCVTNPGEAKNLSSVLKSLGANGSIVGSSLVEADTLGGRGVGQLDLLAESVKRTSPASVAESVASFPEDALRSAVRAILREELPAQPLDFMEPEEFWLRRWEWCVNGSHSRVVERVKPASRVRDLPGVDRWYRRMYCESRADEPLSSWDGEVVVSASEKLEHGKTRAIFACDSLSYFAFEHLLRPVEDAWRGRRAVLDPGKNGHAGMVHRVTRLRERGATSLMLDFDDFNSQHTLSAQQLVIEELCALTHYPTQLGEKLVESFEKMDVYCAGRKVGRVLGTLMSGHRGTTFLNTVLNAAYIRLGCGEGLYDSLLSLHVGDDVYMSCGSYDLAGLVMEGMKRTECRLNPTKQSLGHGTAEFLRVASTRHGAYAYLARGVASTVSGNWVNDVALEPLEGLHSLVQAARTLINRSKDREIYRLLVPSVGRITRRSRRVVRSLLSGDVALGTGPQYKVCGLRSEYECRVMSTTGDIDVPWWDECPDYATTDYLTHVASPVERAALELTGLSVKSAMLTSSYSKALVGGKLEVSRIDHLAFRTRLTRGSGSVLSTLAVEPRKGVLSKYPILHLLRDHLKEVDLRSLVALAGGNGQSSTLSEEAWGSEGYGCIVQGWVSYSDACLLGSRLVGDVMYTAYPYYI